MDKKTRKFIDDYIMRQVQLHRAFEGEAARYAREMTILHDKILKKIKASYGEMSAIEIKRMSKEISDAIIEHYTVEIKPSVQEVAQQVAVKEVTWNTNLMKDVAAGSAQHVVINAVNVDKVARTVLKKTFQGHTFDYWFQASGSQSAKVIGSILMDGYVNNKTTTDVVDNLQGVLNRSRRDIMTLTRSYLSSAAENARDEMFKGNEDIISGYQWLSVLDARTTPDICGVRDGLLYDINYEPIGHSFPWDAGPGLIHFNCRSTKIPILPGLQFTTTRSAIDAGPDYERGDNVTRTGRVRKVNKASVDKGIYDPQQVPSTTRYEDWLKRQPEAYVADILGSEQRATDFLNGKMSLRNFAKETNPINISDL